MYIDREITLLLDYERDSYNDVTRFTYIFGTVRDCLGLNVVRNTIKSLQSNCVLGVVDLGSQPPNRIFISVSALKNDIFASIRRLYVA